MTKATGAWAAATGAMLASAAMAQPVHWRVQESGNGHWYEFRGEQLNWSTAVALANATGGSLLSIGSSSENRFIVGVALQQGRYCDCWTSGAQPGNSPEPGGAWFWRDGTPWSYTNWRTNEPDDSGSPGPNDQNVLEINLRSEEAGSTVFGQWSDEADLPAGIGNPSIVEYSADCNGDGFVDKGQILAGQLPDRDSDGIPDVCRPTSTPVHQWSASANGNGHWYEFVGQAQFFSAAKVIAHARGGQLASLSTTEENGFIVNTTRIHGLWGDWFIGGEQPVNSPEPAGNWRWIDGSAWSFTNWLGAEPDDSGSSGPNDQQCLEINLRSEWAGLSSFGRWSDESEAVVGGGQGYIIEYSADCNGDGVVDKGQILSGQLADLNSNGIPDGCENPCVFSRQPQSQALQPGGNAAFSIEFARLGQSFQWRRDGVNLANSSRITGVTTPNLTINSVAVGDQGSYDCVVTGSCGTVVSQAAALSCKPIISLQPPAQAALVPGLTLTNGVPTNATYTYRWRQNGQNLFNIPGLIAGATTRTLTLLSDDSSLVGTYDCVLTNVCGSTTSDATFIPCPADFNLDGGVDGGDVQALFAEWSEGLESADLNQDGGIDGGDLSTFFTRWEGGC
jgi:hypothetical protein